jgi:hypothetical protein
MVGGLAAGVGAIVHGAWNAIDEGADVTGLPPLETVLEAETGTMP